MNALELNDGRIKLWHGDCIACHRQGCIFWGIEKENSGDKKYFDIAVSRLEAELQKAT